MPAGMIFWLIMILCFIFGFWRNYSYAPGPGGARNFGMIGGDLIYFILFFIVGWKLFGFVIQ
jgi:hypothetical protein